MLADDHVARLDVAVQYAAAVGTRWRCRHRGSGAAGGGAPDRGPGSAVRTIFGTRGVEPLDGLLEAVAADEPHGVIRAAVAVGAQAVDGDDPPVAPARR